MSLQFRMQSREMFQNTLIFLGSLEIMQLHNYNTVNTFLPSTSQAANGMGKTDYVF